MKWYKAKCSQCGTQLRRRTRTELLSALRQHVWSKHRTWMVQRIKAGKKAAAGNPGIVGLLKDLGSGDFIPGYRKYKRTQYEALKPALDVLTKHLPKPIQVSWEIVDRMADIIFKK